MDAIDGRDLARLRDSQAAAEGVRSWGEVKVFASVGCLTLVGLSAKLVRASFDDVWCDG